MEADERASAPPNDPDLPSAKDSARTSSSGFWPELQVRPVLDENDFEAWNALQADLNRYRAVLMDQSIAVIGKFAIQHELGRGGFGVVYMARDTELGRLVALKVPRPELIVTPELRRRFFREAKLAAVLDHPNIVPLLEAGEADSIVYLAATYCPGPTLAAWLRSQTEPVRPWLAARLVASLADAVQHAHDRGVLHRDIKPSNVILSDGSSSSESIPRLTDFGLAKLADAHADTPGETPIIETRSGGWIGSPPYMAPEQAAGRSTEIGYQTDVYAIGATLYELLTGRPPFQGCTAPETIRLVVDAEVIRPRVLRSWLPRDLETICLKCLEKNPAERYGSASALRDDLERFLSDKPILAQPPSVWARTRCWIRHHPVIAAYAMVAAAVVMFLLGVMLWSNDWLRKHNHVLAREIARADRNARIATERRRLADRHLLAANLRLARQALAAAQPERAQEILHDAAVESEGRAKQNFAWKLVRREARCQVANLFEDELGNDRMSDDRPAARGIGGGHYDPAEIQVLALSPSGRHLATADKGGWVRLWDLAEDRLEVQMSGLALHPHRLVFSPDGTELAAVHEEVANETGVPMRASLWDTKTGQLRFQSEIGDIGVNDPFYFIDINKLLAIVDRRGKPQHAQIRVLDAGGVRWSRSGLLAAALSSNGRWIVAAELSRMLILDAKTGLITRALPYQRTGLYTLRISPDGETVAAIVPGPHVVIWDARTGGETRHNIPTSTVATVFSVDLHTLACMSADRDVSLHTLGSGTTAKLMAGARAGDEPYIIGFSPDSTMLALGGRRPVEVWDVASAQRVARFPGRIGPTEFARVLFDNQSQSLLVTDGSRLRRWWFKPGAQAGVALAGHSAEAWAVAFAPDGHRLATGSDDTNTLETIKLWDVATRHVQSAWKGHKATVAVLAFDPSGHTLASGSLESSNNLALWDVATQRRRLVLPGHQGGIRALAYQSDGRILATGGWDCMIRLWDPNTGRLIRALSGHTGKVRGIAYSPDGRILASACEDATTRLWDPSSGRRITTLQHRGQVTAVAFSPDGRVIATADQRGTLSLWDTVSYTRIRTIRSEEGELLALAFSPDSQVLATAGEHGIVRLWDWEVGEELHVLEGHKAKVNALAFAPDGSQLASCDHSGAVYLWRTEESD